MPELIQPTSEIIAGLIQTKLDAVAELARNNQFTTRDDQSRGDLLSSVRIAISDYLRALNISDSSVAINIVKRGNVNSSTLYNAFWNSISNDLNVLYAEANNIGQVLVDHHNYVATDIQNVLIQLKAANSQIQNFSLLVNAPVANYQTFTEKFTDTSKLDINSPLLQGIQCDLDTIGGVVTLGILSAATVTSDQVGDVIIGAAASNGTVFSNTALLDVINSNGIQLFQYELTSQVFTTNKLTLDFTIKLDDPTILNFIRIVPNNFGTKTWPKITAIDLSADGINFNSIRDQLLGMTNNEDEFILAPFTSNFAGEGRFSFLPEKAAYIHFTIEQSTPYFDANRNLYRWAIGIKNIELTGKKFVSSSQLISSAYTFSQGVEKIALDAIELPLMAFTGTTVASKASVQHDISIDDGMTWKPISPGYLANNDPTAPEILNVNNVDSQLNPAAVSSINTVQNVTHVRYRLRLSPNATIINDPDLLAYFSPVVRNITLKVFTQEVV